MAQSSGPLQEPGSQADRAARLQKLFKEALPLAPEERAAFLEATCSDDPDLRRDLESLLLADDRAQAQDFMGEPAADLPALLEDNSEEGDLEGRSIGVYTVLRRVGRGGMGDVYLALRDSPFKQYVALKVIRRGMDTRDILQRFEMERQILASLNHPNIARLLDGGTTDDGLAYFVMEHVEGAPITEYCDSHRLTVDERLGLFLSVCRAVHYAHQNLVVHRDLKPSNIFVTKNGRVKLLDFGVAKLLNPTLTTIAMPITRTMFRMMTPEYASPEQVRGETLTTASDIYALGVLLYELLTGHRPHHITSSSPQEIERIVCELDPARPSTKVNQTETITRQDGTTESITPASVSDARALPLERLRRRLRGDLDNIVMMALRKEAARRYASAEQFAADVERYLGGMPVEARSNTVGYRVRKFVRRNQVVVAAAFIVVLSLVVGLGAAMRQAQQAQRDRDRVMHELTKTEAVADFFSRLFAAIDPLASADLNTAQSNELSARELLRLGADQAEALQSQPEVQAQLLRMIGRIYYNLGLYNQARPMLEHALAERRALLGPEHPDVAQSQNDLAVLLRRMGYYEGALIPLREAVAMQRRLLLGDHPDASRTLNNIGWVLNSMANYAEAETYLRDAFAMRRRIYGPEHVSTLRSMSNLGTVLHNQGRHAEAEPLLRDALALRRKVLGPEHLDVANSQNKLAMFLHSQQGYTEAEPLFREALALRRRLLGEAYPETAESMNNLAMLLYSQEAYTEAEPLLRDALALRQRLLGPEHPDVAESLTSLGLLLTARGAYAEAEPLFKQALETARQHLPEGHPRIQAAEDGLSDLHAAWYQPSS